MRFVYKVEYALDVLHNSFLTASYFEMKCQRSSLLPQST